MDTPGVTVRRVSTISDDLPAPIGAIYGAPRTNDTLFEDGRIRANCMLGKDDEGWRGGALGLSLDCVGAVRYLI